MDKEKSKPLSTLAARLYFLRTNFEKVNALGDHGTFDLMVKKGMYREKSKSDAIFWIRKTLQRLREEKSKA